MWCQKCGAQISDQNNFCPKCGAKVTKVNQFRDNQNDQQYNDNGQMYQQGSQQMNQGVNDRYDIRQPYYNPGMEQQVQIQSDDREQRKQYFKSKECSLEKGFIITAAVLLYISATVTFFIALLSSALMLVDAVILVTVATLLLVLKSRVVSIVCGAYSLINVIAMAYMYHTFGGWLILLAAIFANLGTFMIHSKWNSYKTGRENRMSQFY